MLAELFCHVDVAARGIDDHGDTARQEDDSQEDDSQEDNGQVGVLGGPSTQARNMILPLDSGLAAADATH